MTKVSWKRILQRAGNDLPHHHGRSYPESARPQQPAARPPRPSEPPSLIAGELETELRRALQRSQAAVGPESDSSWDPIYVAREVRHTPPAVPVTNYRELEARNRGGATKSGARNVIAASLSAAVLGFGAYQFGIGWGGGGGGGHGGGNGDTPSQSASVASPLKIADQAKRVETGYAIQPLLQPGQPTDVGPVKEPASLIGPDRGQAERAASEAAAAFKRDMDEAAKYFDERQQAAVPAESAAPERPQAAARQAAPTSRQAPAASTRTAAAPADTVDQPAASSAAPTRMSAVATSTDRNEPALNGQEEDQLLQRASGLMKRGDVTGARLLFEHLAFRGSALGAFALAQSYDPRHLNKLYVRGLTGDQKQADYWYRRAAELGGSARN